ncbi:hypothetical protein [Streptomyces geranii]|uniref:hypothetical protein n=1 Tax=Streptomyces geranii TaxID=2058923 RepID=UPI000D0364A6|nr:hypothetical protein [Streptomyces geranii]
MKVANPEVTLDEEGHGFPKEARNTAMIGWNLVATAHDEDGNPYWFNTGLMSLAEGWGNLDFWQMCVRTTPGQVVQPAGSVHRVAQFPPGLATEWHVKPRGALTVTRTDDQVAVDMESAHIVCTPDGTWHFSVEDEASGIAGEWTHTGNGFPMWYGKETPQTYVPHSISYGYIWAGKVEGTLTVQGKKVEIRGAGQRERYYAVDACPAEVGAWHDWLWFHFDELSGNLDEMKLSRHKDMALYLNEEKRYVQAGDFRIDHHDWAYNPATGTFVPTRYQVTMETEAGVLQFTGSAVGSHAASSVGESPDSPTILLDWPRIEGTFTHSDGRQQTLTNGLGGTLIRQWKPYPDLLVGGSEFQPLDVPRV